MLLGRLNVELYKKKEEHCRSTYIEATSIGDIVGSLTKVKHPPTRAELRSA